MPYDQLWQKANNPRYASHPHMQALLDAWEFASRIQPLYVPDLRSQVDNLIEEIDTYAESKKKENK